MFGNFFRQELGFGEFIFRTEPEGEEVARAHDVREFERQLAVVPEECLFYHASHNHFSIWLMARSEFELAESFFGLAAFRISRTSRGCASTSSLSCEKHVGVPTGV